MREKKLKAITGGAVNRWQEKWIEVKELDFFGTPTESIRMHLVLLSHLVATAPDEESEAAARLFHEKARDELERRLIGPTGDPSSVVNNGRDLLDFGGL